MEGCVDGGWSQAVDLDIPFLYRRVMTHPINQPILGCNYAGVVVGVNVWWEFSFHAGDGRQKKKEASANLNMTQHELEDVEYAQLVHLDLLFVDCEREFREWKLRCIHKTVGRTMADGINNAVKMVSFLVDFCVASHFIPVRNIPYCVHHVAPEGGINATRAYDDIMAFVMELGSYCSANMSLRAKNQVSHV